MLISPPPPRPAAVANAKRSPSPTLQSSSPSSISSSSESSARTPPNLHLLSRNNKKPTLAAATLSAYGASFSSGHDDSQSSIAARIRVVPPPPPPPPPPPSPPPLESLSDLQQQHDLLNQQQQQPAPLLPPSPPPLATTSFSSYFPLPSSISSSELPASSRPASRTPLSVSTNISPQPFFTQSASTGPTGSPLVSSYSFPTLPHSASTSTITTAPSPPPASLNRRDRDRRQSLQIQPVSFVPPVAREPPRERRQSQPLLAVPTPPSPQARGGRAKGRKIFGLKPSNDPADQVNEIEAKVVILGAQGVGKTAIVHRITHGTYSRSLVSTLGASFMTKRLEVDGCKVRLQLWDTAGQERFRSMAPLYYRGALAAILVYDITSLESFDDVKMWLTELRRDMSPDCIIHVVGSKSDLNCRRKVQLQHAQRSVAQWHEELVPSDPAATNEPVPTSPTRLRTRTDSMRTLGGGGAVTPLDGAGGGGTGDLPKSVSMPIITTSAPSLGSRVRKLSSRLVSPPAGLAASTSTGTSSAASSVMEFPPLAQTGTSSSSIATSEGMSRSASRMSLGLTMTLSRSRKSYEEDRRTVQEIEEARLDELVRNCVVQVTEASAVLDEGVDEVFLSITERLVERKAQIENERILRSRDSFLLTDLGPPAVTGTWCC